MNWFDAGELVERARDSGVTADRMGLPPRPGESRNRRINCSVVFWLGDRDHEFTDLAEANAWLDDLLNMRGAA